MKSNQKYTNWKDKIKEYYIKSDRFTKFDWILFVILAGFCFISFVHIDILHTGNRAWVFYDGIMDFYDNAAAWTQGDGANYMPSTFALFALWNLPLKLLGISAPEYLGDFRIGVNFWYKILPLLFFIGSCYMIYRVAKEIGLESHKAKIAMFAFMTMPVCFFSQFIFSQCDIFTIFFMLWGMYYFYRNKEYDMWRFAILFGVATTFKYFAVVIFFVMLLVREKKVMNIVKYTVAGAVPFAVEFLMYYGSAGFQRGVLGFRVLGFVSNNDFSAGQGSLSLVKFGCMFIVLWAYFVHANSKKDEIAWTLYLSCGICFVIFGFCVWHPQWLMFMAPFWVLSAYINVHQEKFLWVDAGLLVILHFLNSDVYKGNVDANIMEFLVWKDVFNFESPQYFIADILPSIDVNTTYSMFLAVLLILFVFKHPKFTVKDFSKKDSTDYMHLIRLRLVLMVAIFSIPALIAAYKNTVSFAGEEIVSMYNTDEMEENNAGLEADGISNIVIR